MDRFWYTSGMFRYVKTEQKSFDPYRVFLTRSEEKEIESLADTIKNKRIVHINATDTGGGVAEMLHALVPLEQSMGLHSSWRVIKGNNAFFGVTKRMHNALQGARQSFHASALSEHEKDIYTRVSKDIGLALQNIHADLIVIHDPQPLLAGSFVTDIPRMCRIHIDMSEPDKDVLSFILPALYTYDVVLFSLEEYAPEGLDRQKIMIDVPAIDPLSEKNIGMPIAEAKAMLANYGVKPTAPLMAQVSRFDIWKDPLGVVEAYRLVKKEIPDVQLILLGSVAATDDPEGVEIFTKIKEVTKSDPDIILISEHNNILVNAVQTGSDVVLQKSLREGFGLTATEAMWKGTPVIAGDVGGLRIQIVDGESGYLVQTPAEAAERTVHLLEHPELRKRMGKNAHQTVRENFLLTTHLWNHLELYQKLIRS
jgi:trehalose synthase